jgi:hypothetical protein
LTRQINQELEAVDRHKFHFQLNQLVAKVLLIPEVAEVAKVRSRPGTQFVFSERFPQGGTCSKTFDLYVPDQACRSLFQ